MTSPFSSSTTASAFLSGFLADAGRFCYSPMSASSMSLMPSSSIIISTSRACPRDDLVGRFFVELLVVEEPARRAEPSRACTRESASACEPSR